MDHDLRLDLGHLDDPQPPAFGALRAEEATRRAADMRSRRARVVAAVVLSVSLVLGIGVATLGGGREADLTQVAEPPPPTGGEVAPEVTSPVPSTLPAETLPPPVTLPAPEPPAGVPVPGPGPVMTPPPGAASPGGGAASPTTASPAAVAPTVAPSSQARATGAPPYGTSAAPPYIRFTVRLDSATVRPGEVLRGTVRLENNGNSGLTLSSDNCGFWHILLYDENGLEVDGRGCAGFEKHVVPAYSVEEAPVQLQLPGSPSLRLGTYDAFVIMQIDELGGSVHSERVVVTVVRP